MAEASDEHAAPVLSSIHVHTTFDDLVTLHRRCRRRMALGAALGAPSLVPLALALMVSTLERDPDRSDSLFLLFVVLLGGIGGGCAASWVTPQRDDLRVFTGAVVGAIAYALLFFGLSLLSYGEDEPTPDGARLFAAAVAVGVLASVYATWLRCAAWLAGRALAVVAHDLPSRAARSVGRLLLSTAIVSAGASYLLDASARLGSGAVVGDAWLQTPLLVALPLAGAIAFLWRARHERRRLDQLAATLARGEHRSWQLVPGESPEGALPLRAGDASASRKAMVQRWLDASPYRTAQGEPLAFVDQAADASTTVRIESEPRSKPVIG